jgi:hypothetical protein
LRDFFKFRDFSENCSVIFPSALSPRPPSHRAVHAPDRPGLVMCSGDGSRHHKISQTQSCARQNTHIHTQTHTRAHTHTHTIVLKYSLSLVSASSALFVAAPRLSLPWLPLSAFVVSQSRTAHVMVSIIFYPMTLWSVETSTVLCPTENCRRMQEEIEMNALQPWREWANIRLFYQSYGQCW